MSESKNNSDGAFNNYGEYATIMEERAGAITAFRAGDNYDFYGDDVEVIVGALPDLSGKVSNRKLPDGSSVDTISVPREKLYDSLESLMDYNDGMLGFVFVDKPGGTTKNEDVSITAAYDKWCRLSQQNEGINILIRNDNFETYGKDAEKVDKRIGGNVGDGEKAYLSTTVVRHSIIHIPRLYKMEDPFSTFDYSGYLRENVTREMKLTAQTSRQNGIAGKKVAADTKKAPNTKTEKETEKETESVSRQKTVYEQHAEMLSAALSKVAGSGGYWLNRNHKSYPQIFYDAGSKPLTPNPYQALMMCLHSDTLDSTLNDYTTYIAAKRAESPVVAGERGVPLLFAKNLRYVNQESKEEISREDYQKLQPDERGKYKGIPEKESRTLFNVEQTVNIGLANEIYEKEHGKPVIHSYDKFTEEERTKLQLRFNDFLLKMKDNLVDIKFSDKAAYYYAGKDVVNLTDWSEARENIRNGEDDYPYYMQHAIRQIVEATGNGRRLNRTGSLQRNGDLPKEEVEKNGELIVEMASAVKMMEFGLPGELTPWSRLKDIDYWKKELKENPQILETIESEVNRSLRMIKKAEMGEKIELNENVGLKKDESISYRIASQLRERPSLKDEETPNIIYVIDRKGKTADVIVPDDVDLSGTNARIRNEGTTNDITTLLKEQGIEDIKYYKSDGEKFYGHDDSYFEGKEIHTATFVGGKFWNDTLLEASSLKARAMDRHLNRADMLRDVNGNWTFMIDSQYNFDVEELEDPVYVHPEKRDLRRYFSTMKNFPGDIQELRLELAQKYQSAVMKDPNLKINPFELKDESLDVSRIKKAYIYKNKEGDIMCKPMIEGEDNIEERKMSVSQWKLLWLAEDMDKIKKSLAAVLFADILKQELTKEQTQETKEETQEVKEEQQVAEEVDDKVFESVTFEGQKYQCRVVQDTDGNSLLVAPTQIIDKLQPYPTDYNELGGFVNEEALTVDNRIFYYTDKDSLQNLSNEELVAMLAKENPEIFQKRETIPDTETRNRATGSNAIWNTARGANGKTAKDEEPYLWIEVSYYGEDSETSHELDKKVKNEEGISLEDYDYSHGEFPDGAFEHAGYSTNGDDYAAFDDDYRLESYMHGGYLLYRKAYLSEIKSVLERDGGLPRNASDNAKDFVRKYCPQYSEGQNLNNVERKVAEKKEPEDLPMLKSYNQLKEKHPDCLLLFRMGDFYEAYQDDAKTVSDILDIALTKRKEKDGRSVQMTGFPYRALDTYLPKLIRAGQRVAICDPKPIEKITPAKTMNKGLNKQENVDAKKATEEEEKPDKDYIVKARYNLGENDGDWHEEAFKDIKATAERLHKDLYLGFDKLDDVDIRVHKSPVPDAYNADLFLCKSGVDVALVSLHFGFTTIKENEDHHVELSNGDVRIKFYGEGDRRSEPLCFEHNMPYEDFLNMVRDGIKELQETAEKKVDLDKDGIVKSRYDMDIDSKSLAKALKKDVTATVGKLSADLGLNSLPGFHAYVSVFERGAIFEKDKLECSAVFPIDATNIMRVLLKFDTFGKDQNDSHVELAGGSINIVSGGAREGDRINIPENISYDELLNMACGKIEELRSEQSRAGKIERDEENGRADGLNAKETVKEAEVEAEEETERRQHSMRR